jgi:DNA-binding NarL/FixJ family response regulator
MTTQNKIRVLIADDHPMVREGLCGMLTSSDIEVVGEAETGQGAVEMALTLDPSVVLVDLRMPDLTGLEACRLLHQQKPSLPILILTMYDSPQYMAAAISAGAAGYILKGITRESLLSTVRTAAQGSLLWDPVSLQRFARKTGRELPIPLPEEELESRPSLSLREREVLALLAQGLNNREIAETCSLSVSTVKTHIEHLLHKLAVTDRVQAAVWAVRNGYVELNRI